MTLEMSPAVDASGVTLVETYADKLRHRAQVPAQQASDHMTVVVQAIGGNRGPIRGGSCEGLP